MIKEFLLSAALIPCVAYAEETWEVVDLRRLTVYECSGDRVERVEVPCDPKISFDTEICYEDIDADIDIDCDWIDTADTEQVSYFDGTMFILKDTENNWPLQMIFFAEMESNGLLYEYEYDLELNQESFDIRQMSTDDPEAPTVFFTKYGAERYKFNLDTGNGQLMYWNFWPVGGI